MNIVCTLKGGGLYNEEWVRKLKNGFSRHFSMPHRFVCLTDMDVGYDIEAIPLEHNWPGYWSKVELFKPGLLDGPTLFTDLDVLICGSVDGLSGNHGGFVMLEDYYPEIYNSTLMYFDASNKLYSGIYTYFKEHEIEVQDKYAPGRHGANFGDQLYIQQWLWDHGQKVNKWQDILPREMFMPFCYTSRLNPEVEQWYDGHPAAYVYCLGPPKFNEMAKLPIVRNHWV